jgi:hypothetical protein
MAFVNTGIVSVTLAVLVSCGGGGGKPYPPSVEVNKINLARIPWDANYQALVTSLFEFPGYEEFRNLRSQQEALHGSEHEGVYHAGKIFEFTLGEKRYLLTSKGKTLLIFSGETLVKKIRLPRYMMWAHIENVVLGGAEYVVVYINQQATSNTSTLFVFDESLDLKYQEHLMGAEAIGFGEHDTYGNFFFVKSKEYMMVGGIKTSLSGDWLYYLPHSKVK